MRIVVVSIGVLRLEMADTEPAGDRHALLLYKRNSFIDWVGSHWLPGSSRLSTQLLCQDEGERRQQELLVLVYRFAHYGAISRRRVMQCSMISQIGLRRLVGTTFLGRIGFCPKISWIYSI
jgi:hypothetical protein